QGEELCAVARLAADGSDLPRSVTITGRLDGKPFTARLPVTVAGDGKEGGYLPRTWARQEIDRLLALDAKKHQKKIVELSMQMYVMSPFTSLLVLEDDQMHKRFKIDFGRKDHWALYDYPKKIKVVYEPLPDEPGGLRRGTKRRPGAGKPTADQVL